MAVTYSAITIPLSAQAPGALADDEMINLVESHGGTPSVGWWSRVGACSLGWVSARKQDGLLVGFVNVAWEGIFTSILNRILLGSTSPPPGFQRTDAGLMH